MAWWLRAQTLQPRSLPGFKTPLHHDERVALATSLPTPCLSLYVYSYSCFCLLTIK